MTEFTANRLPIFDINNKFLYVFLDLCKAFDTINTPFIPGLRPRCDRILGFGRNDRGHSPSVSKTVSVRSPLSQKWSRTLSLTRHWSGRFYSQHCLIFGRNKVGSIANHSQRSQCESRCSIVWLQVDRRHSVGSYVLASIASRLVHHSHCGCKSVSCCRDPVSARSSLIALPHAYRPLN